jgi:tetratricopeptide (TPR) repeat protein
MRTAGTRRATSKTQKPCARLIVPLGLLLATIACIAGCDREPQSHAPAASARLSETAGARPPVSLPDLSSVTESVQARIRERYASLKTKIDNAETPATELAAAYGGLGEMLLAAEFFDAAESCFLNAASLEAAEMRWPYYLGHVQRLRNDPGKAIPFFEQSLRLRPDYVPALIWLGETYLTQNRSDAAEPLFTKALSLQPQAATALYGLGRTSLAKQNYSQAVTYLERALALAPQASRIQYPLAMAYRGKGDATRAEAHLKRRGDVEIPLTDPLMSAIGNLLENASSYEVRGAEALEKRDWPAAVTALRKAIDLAPENALIRLNLGTALYLSGQAREALEQFQAAVRLSPTLPKAHYSIGVIMETIGRDDQAIEEFSAAVKNDSGFVEARLQLADALRRTGRPADSLPHYAEVIKTNPAASAAHFGYAMALVRLGRYRQARDRLAAAMKAFPEQPGMAHALARLLAAAPDDQVRNGARALALVQDLLAKQTSLGLAETKAMALAELGRYDEAAGWQRQAIAASTQAGRSDLSKQLTENLRLYERKQPCRTPWRDDDPVFHPQPPQ